MTVAALARSLTAISKLTPLVLGDLSSILQTMPGCACQSSVMTGEVSVQKCGAAADQEHHPQAGGLLLLPAL